MFVHFKHFQDIVFQTLFKSSVFCLFFSCLTIITLYFEGNNRKALVQEDSSWNLPKIEKIIIKIVPGLGIYCKFFNPVQEFPLKMRSWKTAHSVAQYEIVPLPSRLILR